MSEPPCNRNGIPILPASHKGTRGRLKSIGPGARASRRARSLLNAGAAAACVYCGSTVGRFTVDHVVPLSRGGADTPDNRVLACESCNQEKGNRTPDEWRAGVVVKRYCRIATWNPPALPSARWLTSAENVAYLHQVEKSDAP